MASFCCLSAASTSKTLAIAPPFAPLTSFSSDSTRQSCSCSLVSMPMFGSNRRNLNNRRTQKQAVRMAPEEEKLTRRNPLDFPIEWERPKPGRRPDIFPQFSPMKTPLPPPLPCDPPEEDEEEEEKKEKKEEEEEDPEKEETEKPDNQ